MTDAQLADLIARIQTLTDRDEEICLYFYPRHVSRTAGAWGPEEITEEQWSVGVKNPSSQVSIGEISAVFETTAATLDQALTDMVDLLEGQTNAGK